MRLSTYILPFLRRSVTVCALACCGLAACQTKQVAPEPDPVVPATPTFYAGADLSYVNTLEAQGAVYRDSGRVKDPYRLFRDRGFRLVRVRLWNEPAWQNNLGNAQRYSDLPDVVRTIRRAKQAGMEVLLDLHYSDRWADPAHQDIPAAWNGLALPAMKDSVFAYTTRVLQTLAGQQLTPEWIQVGNENNSGMLWPTGKVVNNSFDAFGQLLNSGIRAVRQFSASSSIKPKIILHVAQFQNADYWAGGIRSAGVKDYDVLGISHYHDYSTLTDLSQVSGMVSALKTKFQKEVMVVETAYPFTTAAADSYNNILSVGFGSFGVSEAGQKAYLQTLAQELKKGGALGLIYWEPAWISTTLKDGWGTGSSWENCALFDFQGNALPGMEFAR